MARSSKLAAAGIWLACAVCRAFALDCSRASTPSDQTICRQPDLAHSDAELNDIYDRLRPQLTAQARASVVTQQRAWITERNRVCANGDPECLGKEYGARVEYLSALYAAASASDNSLSDLHPLVVTGSWKATAIHDPGAKDLPGETAAPQSLSDDELPAIGALVSSAPGKVCIQGYQCKRMAWTRSTLAKADGGEAIGRVLGLSQSVQILLGDPGAKMIPPLVLVVRENGRVWAVFGLCGPKVTNCHYAAEEWTPVGPSYLVSQLP